jgi:hypothetical protein
MSSTAFWVRQHRLTSFFGLAYVVSWTPWAPDAAGMSLGRRAPESAIDAEPQPVAAASGR